MKETSSTTTLCKIYVFSLLAECPRGKLNYRGSEEKKKKKKEKKASPLRLARFVINSFKLFPEDAFLHFNVLASDNWLYFTLLLFFEHVFGIKKNRLYVYYIQNSVIKYENTPCALTKL